MSRPIRFGSTLKSVVEHLELTVGASRASLAPGVAHAVLTLQGLFTAA